MAPLFWSKTSLLLGGFYNPCADRLNRPGMVGIKLGEYIDLHPSPYFLQGPVGFSLLQKTGDHSQFPVAVGVHRVDYHFE
jgi:hypothetical protein